MDYKHIKPDGKVHVFQIYMEPEMEDLNNILIDLQDMGADILNVTTTPHKWSSGFSFTDVSEYLVTVVYK